MNIFKYLQRQLNRLKIDFLTQRTFLAGDIPAIDSKNLIKTANSNYEELETIFFEDFSIKSTDVIIDVGCGKGRVFNYLLYKGLRNKMIGYEINSLVGEKTKKRLARYKNVEIVCGNIFDSFPKQGNVFYLYHPFKEAMMRTFMGEILKVADRNPIILYNNPAHVDVFDNDDFTYQVFDVPVNEYNYSFRFAIISLKKSS
jgi:SAM-dependent methyltransferase